jgi:hypothetical protein
MQRFRFLSGVRYGTVPIFTPLARILVTVRFRSPFSMPRGPQRERQVRGGYCSVTRRPCEAVAVCIVSTRRHHRQDSWEISAAVVNSRPRNRAMATTAPTERATGTEIRAGAERPLEWNTRCCSRGGGH